jgi:hypothetical protein
VELPLSVNAKVADVLWILGLDLRVLDPEAEICGRLELSLPANAIINLFSKRGNNLRSTFFTTFFFTKLHESTAPSHCLKYG